MFRVLEIKDRMGERADRNGRESSYILENQ